jgi:hypothetical protein
MIVLLQLARHLGRGSIVSRACAKSFHAPVLIQTDYQNFPCAVQPADALTQQNFACQAGAQRYLVCGTFMALDQSY